MPATILTFRTYADRNAHTVLPSEVGAQWRVLEDNSVWRANAAGSGASNWTNLEGDLELSGDLDMSANDIDDAGDVGCATVTATGAITCASVTATAAAAGATVAATTTVTAGTDVLLGNNLTFDQAAVTPVIAQADEDTASTTGDLLEVAAQNATGATSTGGTLALRGGTGTTAGGSVELRQSDGTALVEVDDTGVGLFGATPVAQQATTGTTTGFTAGSGTAANDDSTFTGNSGTAAYTVGDIVLALKNLGILAAS